MSLITIEIDSNLTPAMTVSDTDFVGGAGGGPPSLLLRLLRPQFTISSPLGNKVIAPYGAPIRWYFGLAILAVFLFGLGVLARHVVRSAR